MISSSQLEWIKTGMNALQSPSMQELALSGIKTHRESVGRGFTLLDTMQSGIAAAASAPIWTIKHLASLILATPFACFPVMDQADKEKQLGYQARCLLKREALNLGLDVLSPLLPFANFIYSLSPLKEEVKGNLPSVLSSSQELSASLKAELDKLASSIGGRDVLTKLLQWIERNPQLAIELIEDIPELKPFVNHLPAAASALQDIQREVYGEEQLSALADKLEEMATPPVIQLAMAVANRHFAAKGNGLAKIDHALTCTAIALNTPFHLLTQVFSMAAAAPFALISTCSGGLFFKHSVRFLETQSLQMKLNAHCLAASLASILFPSVGKNWVSHQLAARLPKSVFNLMQALASDGQDKLEDKIREVEALARFLADPQLSLSAFIPKITAIVQRSPDNFQKLAELIDIIPALSEAMPVKINKELAPLVPHLAKLAEKNPEVIEQALKLVTEGGDPIEFIHKIAEENPQLKDQVIATLTESPETIRDIALLAANNSHLVQDLAPDLQSFVPHIPDVADFISQQPEIVQQALQQPQIMMQHALPFVAGESEAIGKAVGQFATQHPGLTNQFSSILHSFRLKA
ncbi:hypothetical protein [Candidatus Protochlamydia phocaeensis]|uniref:hypothetical protein n=1 Tax=Candidatus Protochlamydia phocaeensis TaxID=1414722 RepID=UPI00083955AC|nr:hypothetical protein [Candidatus Protochlamydia phocaeensis]